MDPHSQNVALGGPQAGNPVDGRTGPYKFNSDELRVLRECNRESFFQRSLPIGTLLGLGTYYATKAGFLKPSVKWGAVPKVGLAVVFGYFAGKVSYQQKCAEKIMKLPNSPLAEVLRKRRQQGETFTMDPSLALATVPSSGLVADSFEVYSDRGARSTTELDFSQPMMSIDTSNSRPLDYSESYRLEQPLPEATKTTTYEDLRAQNRADYEKKRLSPNNRGVLQPESPSSVPQISRSAPSAAGEQTNAYGDTWIR